MISRYSAEIVQTAREMSEEARTGGLEAGRCLFQLVEHIPALEKIQAQGEDRQVLQEHLAVLYKIRGYAHEIERAADSMATSQ